MGGADRVPGGSKRKVSPRARVAWSPGQMTSRGSRFSAQKPRSWLSAPWRFCQMAPVGSRAASTGEPGKVGTSRVCSVLNWRPPSTWVTWSQTGPAAGGRRVPRGEGPAGAGPGGGEVEGRRGLELEAAFGLGDLEPDGAGGGGSEGPPEIGSGGVGSGVGGALDGGAHPGAVAD